MVSCYDRSNERITFTQCNKNVIFFVNAHGNGMTTFLKAVLLNQQYIYIKENCEEDIIFDTGSQSINNYDNVRKSFLDIQLEHLENAKSFLNLFYLVKDLGTFFRNVGIDLTDKRIKELNYDKYSFEAFLSDYISMYNDKVINIIIEHADRSSNIFISKVKNLLNLGKIRLIFTLSSPVVKAEFNDFFYDYKIIDFTKPKYEDALIIFDSLNMDRTVYDYNMYASSSNLFDFFRKYQNRKRELCPSTDIIKKILQYFLIQIPCLYSKTEFNILCNYLVNNAFVNKSIDSSKYLKNFCDDGSIIERDNLYCTTESQGKNIEVDEIFISFAYYALNFYSKLSYSFLYFLFSTLYKNNLELSSSILEYMINQSTNQSEINNIISYYRKYSYSYSSYLNICKILFNKRMYEYVFEYGDTVNHKLLPFNDLLSLIIADKKHKQVSISDYHRRVHKCLKEYKDKNIQCMITIIYLDFCINHNKKNMKKFLNKRNILFYGHYKNSKYFFILESIIAFYLSSETLAFKLYDDALCRANGIENIHILNNKFAYVLARHINYGFYSKLTDKLYKEICNKNKWVKSSSFFNANLLLYSSIKAKKNKFDLTPYRNSTSKIYNSGLKTWDLYKIINANILDFIYSDNFNVSNYTEMEKLIINTNRAPALNIYFYNLYVIATYYEDKMLIHKAEQFLAHSRDFKFSNIYNTYQKAKKCSTDQIKNNKQKFVRFGYIFSRFTEVSYLFDEIEVCNK